MVAEALSNQANRHCCFWVSKFLESSFWPELIANTIGRISPAFIAPRLIHFILNKKAPKGSRRGSRAA